MNTRKLFLGLIAGATLGMAAPVFADYHHDRGRDGYRHSEHFRGYDRHDFRGYDHRPYAYGYRPYYVQRPVIIQQPMYYGQAAPPMGIGQMVGSMLGGIYDSRQ